jgi:hypothetical protein
VSELFFTWWPSSSFPLIRDRSRRVIGIEPDKSIVLEMDRAVCAFGQRLAQHL